MRLRRRMMRRLPALSWEENNSRTLQSCLFLKLDWPRLPLMTQWTKIQMLCQNNKLWHQFIHLSFWVNQNSFLTVKLNPLSLNFLNKNVFAQFSVCFYFVMLFSELCMTLGTYFCSVVKLPLVKPVACGPNKAAKSISKNEKAWPLKGWGFHVRSSSDKVLLSTVATVRLSGRRWSRGRQSKSQADGYCLRWGKRFLSDTVSCHSHTILLFSTFCFCSCTAGNFP